MKASEQTFSKVIQSDNGNEHYHIPKYQRAYSWSQPNWAQLFDDIDENEAGHFIGSIICIDDHNNRKPGHDLVYELIDGQQRMTSLSLLMAGIYLKLSQVITDSESDDESDADEIEEIKAKRRGIGLQLVKKIKEGLTDQRGAIKTGKKSILLRVQPSTQNSNLDDYLHIMSHCGVLDHKKDSPSHFGNRSMAKAYRYFQSRLPSDINALVALTDKINQLQLVYISVNSHSNAFRLFETLNNRGVPLTAVDIIKNKMLAEMERQHQIAIDEAYELWQEMLEDIEGIEDRFLRQFYNAFKHKEKIGQPRYAAKATSSTLIAIFENMINGGAQFVFDELVAKAKVYGEITQPDESSALSLAFMDLSRIGAVPSNTLLLYLMTLEDGALENKNTILNFVHFLQKYFVRRNITDTPSTRDLDQLQIDVIDACEKRLKNKKTISTGFLIEAYCKGRGEPASLADFKENIADNLFYHNKQMARYVLVKLDETAHSREYKPDFWARNDEGQYVWTVEHIFPQGEKIPKHWVDMIADGDSDAASEIQEDWVHCLGNLTLSGYNSRLSNHSFDRKQSKAEITAAGHKIHIGYQNGLFLNKLAFKCNRRNTSLATIESWTKPAIESRNSKMVEMLCKQYRFDHEDALDEE